MLAGVDEAGRGPVIGPMVCAIAYGDESFQDKLRKVGVKDSKLLTEKERQKLFEKVNQIVKTDYIVVGIKEIDAAVANNKLNQLEMDKFAELINKHNPKKVIIDCPVKDTKKFERQIKEQVSCEVQAENKADLNYAMVAAASIVAKEIREREVAKIKKEIGMNCGSGYPSDPITQEFIKKHWKNYDIFRKSWQTYKNLKNNSTQQTLL